MNPRRVVLAVVVGLVAALSISWASDDASPVAVSSTTTTAPEVVRVWPEPVVEAYDVTGTRSGLTGVMMVQGFTQEPYTSGPTPQQLRMVFPKPARIYGITISVDLGDPRMTTVEVDAGVNVTHPYGLEPDANGVRHYEQGDVAWLLHTSSSNGADIDQQVMFPKPIDVAAGEFVTVSGWIRNDQATADTAYPETIVYYEWI